MWNPITFEDELLAAYHKGNPGILYLEVVIGQSDGRSSARRIDGVLVSEAVSSVRPYGTYSLAEFADAVDGKHIHVLEAKRDLNRAVIGQILVAVHLIEQDFDPCKISSGVVVSRGNTDLAAFCESAGIHVHLHPELASFGSSRIATEQRKAPMDSGRRKVMDSRRPGDLSRRRAFLSGWTAAVNGRLFETVMVKKTHANMGNLFGWIYGQQSREFKLETWERYLDATQRRPNIPEEGEES